MKKQLVILAVLVMVSAQIFAFEVNNINYQMISQEIVQVVSSYPEYSGDITIPETVTYNETTYTVVEIASNAFQDCTGLTSISLPASIESIGSEAFANCTGLTSVEFKGALCQQNISDNAFNGVGYSTPVTLILPANWENQYLPLDNLTAWHGGYFNSNRINIDPLRQKAIDDIAKTMGEYKDNAYIKGLVTDEIANINIASTEETIITNRDSAINKLKIAVLSYEQGKLDVLGSMSSPCTDCPAVEVSNGTTNVTLYNPTNVNFRKVTK